MCLSASKKYIYGLTSHDRTPLSGATLEYKALTLPVYKTDTESRKLMTSFTPRRISSGVETGQQKKGA
ncbi:hypothetical protein V5O48_004498 [Marasmius crinis-equi]|uniref:Uncharacterized protein n=1 Tax=Marasmius crinis-equi TaxID=585013 RepID=A0ABR3FEA2_9AGAR